jgi:transcriptional regulator with XRE-family HTH domain
MKPVDIGASFEPASAPSDPRQQSMVIVVVHPHITGDSGLGYQGRGQQFLDSFETGRFVHGRSPAPLSLLGFGCDEKALNLPKQSVVNASFALERFAIAVGQQCSDVWSKRRMDEAVAQAVDRILDVEIDRRVDQKIDEILARRGTRAPAVPNAIRHLPIPDTHVAALDWLEHDVGLSQEQIRAMIGVSRPTIISWRKGGQLRDEHRQRILAVRDVIERARERHPEREQFFTWLDRPRGRDAVSPRELLQSNQINRARLLAIADEPRRLTPEERRQRGMVADRFTVIEGRRKDTVESQPTVPTGLLGDFDDE